MDGSQTCLQQLRRFCVVSMSFPVRLFGRDKFHILKHSQRHSFVKQNEKTNLLQRILKQICMALTEIFIREVLKLDD